MIWKLRIAVAAVAVATLAVVIFQSDPNRAFKAPRADGARHAATAEGDPAAGRTEEAAAIATHDGLARRRDDFLFISQNGGDTARFRDLGYCDGFDQCSRWRFKGVLRDGKHVYPLVTLFGGPGQNRAYLVAPSGVVFRVNDRLVPSPDGKVLVVADGGRSPSDDGKDRRFEIDKGYQRLAF